MFNASVNKFKNYLKNKIANSNTSLANGYVEYEKRELKDRFKYLTKAKKLRTRLVAKIYLGGISLYKLVLKYEYKQKNKASYEKIKEMERLLSYISGNFNGTLKEYELLETYLYPYNITGEEKAEILAYFMNFEILKFEKQVEKDQIQHKDDLSLRNDIAWMRTIITPNGSITSYRNVQDQYRVFNRYFDLNYVNAVLETSKNMAIREALKRSERHNAKVTKEQAEKNSTEKLLREQRKNKEAKLTEASAKKEIREYLDESNQPIKYITEEDQKRIMELMITLNYSFHIKDKVKRTIAVYNKKFLEKQQHDMYVKAKNKFLTSSEISLLNAVETITTIKESENNPNYKELVDMFLEIKEKLIFILNNSDNPEIDKEEEIGYIMLCIEELSKLLSYYRSANYALNRTKNYN